MTPFMVLLKALKPLPNPSTIMDLMPLISMSMTTSDTTLVESLKMTLVLRIGPTTLSLMLDMTPLKDIGSSVTLGEEAGENLDTSKCPWAKILAMLNVILGYLKSDLLSHKKYAYLINVHRIV